MECCGVDCCNQLPLDKDAGLLPPRPAGPAGGINGQVVLAVSRLYLGDTDRNGKASPTAWAQYGLNIDGKETGVCSMNVCTLVPGGSKQAQIDGENGIDNAFGSQLLPLIEAIDSTYTSDANTALQQGDATLLVELAGDEGAASYSRLPGATLRALPTSNPKWNGTDTRAIDQASLLDGAPSQPAVELPDGYMSDRTWVSVPASGRTFLDLHVVARGQVLPPVPIQHVQIVMRVAADGGNATSGVLSGVIRTSDAVTWSELWLGAADGALCSEDAAAGITMQVAQASDIMSDGTNDPGQQCDAISVGLGFDAVAVQLGQPGAGPAYVNPCDAGGD
jgi:hypothetical protein